MNWCKIIGHKWKYDKEDIIYERINTGHSLIKLNNEATLSTEVRLCKRCYKKQRMSWTGFWTDWHLTEQEIREIKLKELGI